MDKIKLKILGLSSSQAQTSSFALVLGEEQGNRRLPIIIGMFEAQAIAIEIERIVPNRPMTHDLFKSFAQSFDFEVQEIIISDLKEGVFFAKIVCSDGTKVVEIDSRPSDAIAIAIRFNVDIYSHESILSEAGIVFSSEDEDDLETEETVVLGKEKPFEELIKDYSNDKLNELLNETITKEDYEKAAKIRDEMKRRN